MPSSQSRAIGTLLGLACGDALGRPVEFKDPTTIEEIYGSLTEMEANGTYGQPEGSVTDDTELMLCVARSLVENQSFNPEDTANKFLDWKATNPPDIGLMTSASLDEIERGGSIKNSSKRIWTRRDEGSNAGNGSVMRCAPYGIAFRNDMDSLVNASHISSRITHYDDRCQWGCSILNLTIAGFLNQAEHPFGDAMVRAKEENAPEEVIEMLAPAASSREKFGLSEPDLQNTGYSLHTLQAALFHGLSADTAEDAIIDAVNMGGDADTLGAVTGAVAGARFGANALPDRWLDVLDKRDEIENLASDIHDMTFSPVETRIP